MCVINLVFDEAVRFEPSRLADLYRRLGEVGAENALCDAMEELTIQLVRIDKLAKRDKVDDVCQIAEKIAPVAGQIGLRGLECVAYDVAACGRNGDHHGFAATVARIGRMGNKSLSTIWDPQGMSI